MADDGDCAESPGDSAWDVEEHYRAERTTSLTLYELNWQRGRDGARRSEDGKRRACPTIVRVDATVLRSWHHGRLDITGTASGGGRG